MNVVMAGVGGQGIILASDILAEVAMRHGYDVKKSEIHGMAQRGGSVMSHIRFSEKVFSPVIPEGECDILLSFEELETARYLDFLRPDAWVLINRYRLPPPTVSIGKEMYPEVEGIVREKTRRIVFVDAGDIALSLGNKRVLNSVLLGVLSTLLEPDTDTWEQCIAERLPEKVRDVNIMAFRMGRDIRQENKVRGG